MTHKPEMHPESNQQFLRRGTFTRRFFDNRVDIFLDDPAAAPENAAAHNNTEERIPSVSHDQANHSDENAPRRENTKAWGDEWNGGQMSPGDWEHRQIIQETVQVSEPSSNLLKPGLTTRVKGMCSAHPVPRSALIL